MGDEIDKVRGPVMTSDPEVLKAARHIRGQLAGTRASVEELRRLAGAKAALAEEGRGQRKTLLAHGVDAAAYADQLEDAADVLAWLEAMVDALETGPENFIGLQAEEIDAGWRIVRDGAGAELKFLLEACSGETAKPTGDIRRSPNFNLIAFVRRNREELWSRPAVHTLDGLLAPMARAVLPPFLDKVPNRQLYLEMSRALQAGLVKALRDRMALPEVATPTPPTPEAQFERGDRVYHRKRDLFAEVREVWTVGFDGANRAECDVTLVVKFEPPWDQTLPEERLPQGEFVSASSARGN